MRKERYFHIDFLKAVAIIVLMTIHVLSYSLNNQLIFNLWNWLHFVVPIFVFASGYLFASNYHKHFFNNKSFILWIKKRLIRLLLPYYFFLFLHYYLWLVFPQFFQGLGLSKDLKFILSSIFLFGGVDFNWFVLLFIQLTIFSPLVVFSLKNKNRFLIVFFTSALFSLYFFFFRFSYQNFKWLMVFSWLMVFYFGMASFLIEKKLKDLNIKIFYFFSSIIFGLIFFLFYLRQPKIVFTENKYPPNLAYLSYGLTINYLLIFLSFLFTLTNNFLKRGIVFFSKNSYNLFFSHYILIDFVFKLNKNFDNFLNLFAEIILIFILSIFPLILFSLLLKKN